MTKIKLGSLFDGAGGFPLAATMAGITPVWASEIEPFPIRVTTRRFPKMKHIGNITEINGADIEPVDIITFGSPCQDLSVANGNRKGLDGERSGLFREAIRIIKEMREETNGRYPTFIVWENVPGAFSSNGGDDFKQVLQEIANIKDPTVSLRRPENGKWSKAGEYVGNGWSIAYRVYDAQYWGVPQRRKRIYLVADFRGQRAGRIQFERDSLCGNTSQSGGAGEETTAEAGISPAIPSGTTYGFHGHKSVTGNICYNEERAPCLETKMPPNVITPEIAGGGNPMIILNDQGGSIMGVSYGVTATLRAEEHGHQPIVAIPQAASTIGTANRTEYALSCEQTSHFPQRVVEQKQDGSLCHNESLNAWESQGYRVQTVNGVATTITTSSGGVGPHTGLYLVPQQETGGSSE